ncbi:MAG TPA: efflux RND transporter periplasmic adaptor subunit, partial [Candidatus Aminicenantes bacterium]|nr:efflux RND transporter periplasmic adaptor subunit [Candidatus Aminicenantes bacterium]
MKKASIIAAIVIVIALGIFLLTGSKEENPEEAYQFVKVERGDVEALVSSTGTLNAVTTVQVGTQVSGRIAKIFTDFNQRVKQGQVIAQLDTSTLLMAVDSAQSNYAKAMAQLQQAVTDLHRTELLFQEKIRTKNDLEQAQINHTTAKANLQAAKSELERSRINLSYATIYAPIDGVVISRDIDVGQTVAASFTAPTLFQIANDLSKMQILASVDESDIGQIKEGQGARFTVQAYPERNFPGRVSQIRMQPTTTQNVVNYTVVVEVDNPGMLLPGMTA